MSEEPGARGGDGPCMGSAPGRRHHDGGRGRQRRTGKNLIRNGDGQARSLAKEYSLTFTGLTAAVRMIVDLREDASLEAGTATLLRSFRSVYSSTILEVLGDDPGGSRPTAAGEP